MPRGRKEKASKKWMETMGVGSEMRAGPRRGERSGSRSSRQGKKEPERRSRSHSAPLRQRSRSAPRRPRDPSPPPRQHSKDGKAAEPKKEKAKSKTKPKEAQTSAREVKRAATVEVLLETSRTDRLKLQRVLDESLSLMTDLAEREVELRVAREQAKTSKTDSLRIRSQMEDLRLENVELKQRVKELESVLLSKLTGVTASKAPSISS